MDKTPCLTALRLDRALPAVVWGLFEACQGEGVMGVRGVEAQVAREVRFAEKGLWDYAGILELQCARGTCSQPGRFSSQGTSNHCVAPRGLRVYAFVDAGQLRAGLEEIGAPWRDLDLMAIARVGLTCVGRTWQGLDMVISRVFVYDAVAEKATSVDDETVDAWLSRNNDQIDVHVRRGRLAGDPRKPKKRRQQAVDVQLAVDALTYASNGVFEVALLVTGDGDFAPVAEAVRDKGPLVAVYCFKSKLSPLLREVADRVGYLSDDPAAYEGWKLPAT